ncbi:hypothetical protein DPMN_089115, partial [Dreissena polymorpha]
MTMPQEDVRFRQGSGTIEQGTAFGCKVLFNERVIRSLVTTNDHLLKELDETRERHQHR